MSDLLINSSSLSIHALVLIFASMGFYDANHCKHDRSIRVVLLSVLTLIVINSLVFCCLQIQWVMGAIYENLSRDMNVGWLIFDWINAMTALAMILGIRVFVHWKPQPACMCERCPAIPLSGAMLSHQHDLQEIDRTLNDLMRRVDEIALSEGDGK